MMQLTRWPNKFTAKFQAVSYLIFFLGLSISTGCSSKGGSVSTPSQGASDRPTSLDSLNQGLAYIREHPAEREEDQIQRYIWLDSWVKVLQDRNFLTPEMSQQYWNDFDSFLKHPPATTGTLDRITSRATSKIGKNVALYAAYQEFLKAQQLEDSLKFLEKVEEDSTTGLYTRSQEILQLNRFQPQRGSRKIGVLLPLSGDLKAFAQEALLGVQLASRMAIAEGVEFIIEDSGGTPEKFQQTWEKLSTQENVAAILGPLTAKETEAAFERAELMRVPVISLAAKEDLKSYGGYSFRSVLSLEDQISGLSSFLVDRLRSKKIAILTPDSTYGWDVMDRASKEFSSRGLEISDVQVYPANGTDFKEQLKRMARLDQPKLRKGEVCPKNVTDPAEMPAGCVKKIGELKPILGFDTLFLPDFADTAGLVLPTLPFLQIYGIQVVGLAGMNSKKLIERAGEASEGTIFVDSYTPNSMRLPARIFREDYMKMTGREPTRIAAEAYDLSMIATEIMTRDTMEVSRDLFVDRLRRVENFEGVTGIIRFENQRLKKTPEILIVRNQEIRALK